MSEQFEISLVPTFVFIKNKAVIDRLEGADAAELTRRVERWAERGAMPPSSSSQLQSLTGLHARLERLITAAPAMLFIKGSPEAPKCKFSRQAVELLRSLNASFGSFDILSSETVRQGLKEYSNWPTYPQFFVGGRFVGGLDILQQLHEEGELEPMLPKLPPPPTPAVATTTTPAAAASPAGEAARLEARLRGLVSAAPVVLFMKGTPSGPECGFSEQAVALLAGAGIVYKSFNILSDAAVREGLKTLFNWPTYPQLYVNGALVGGLDVLKQLAEEADTPLADALGVPASSRTTPSSSSSAAPGAQAPSEADTAALDARIRSILGGSRVVLFMKGTPEAPVCGFSKKAVALLEAAGVDVHGAASAASAAAFRAVNILEDEAVRGRLKALFDWPTYPQVYVDGALVGGVDILSELAEAGELATLLGSSSA